jgi:hypothetical protein
MTRLAALDGVKSRLELAVDERWNALLVELPPKKRGMLDDSERPCCWCGHQQDYI